MGHYFEFVHSLNRYRLQLLLLLFKHLKLKTLVASLQYAGIWILHSQEHHSRFALLPSPRHLRKPQHYPKWSIILAWCFPPFGSYSVSSWTIDFACDIYDGGRQHRIVVMTVKMSVCRNAILCDRYCSLPTYRHPVSLAFSSGEAGTTKRMILKQPPPTTTSRTTWSRHSLVVWQFRLLLLLLLLQQATTTFFQFHCSCTLICSNCYVAIVKKMKSAINQQHQRRQYHEQLGVVTVDCRRVPPTTKATSSTTNNNNIFDSVVAVCLNCIFFSINNINNNDKNDKSKLQSTIFLFEGGRGSIRYTQCFALEVILPDKVELFRPYLSQTQRQRCLCRSISSTLVP